jgi:hypothetical protein
MRPVPCPKCRGVAFMAGPAGEPERQCWQCGFVWTPLVTSLADLMRTADPTLEPRRDQPVIVAGQAVVMLVVLDLTAVVVVDGERVLVRHDQVEIPAPDLLRWQRREAMTASERKHQARHRNRTSGN